MKNYVKIYIFFIISIFTSIFYLFYIIKETKTTLYNNFEKTFTQQAIYFANNIESLIKKEIPKDLYKTLEKNINLRIKLQNSFSLLVTPTFKYIYVLYKDKNGKYRYLLDGSKNDKGEFGERLNVDKTSWNKAYDSGLELILVQKNLESIWGTFLKPIKYNNKTEAIIAIDFSSNLPASIYNATQPIKNIFLYIFISITLLLLILIWQTLINIKIKKESITDVLTQTYNRNFLRDFLNKFNPEKYQIIMLDIDHFKKVNDIYGHKAGDYILSEVANIIKKTIRKDDYIIRFGGEEFLIFIKKDNKETNYAKEISEKISKDVEKVDFLYNGNKINITVSIGVTVYPDHFKSATDAIKKADEMLYIAKKQGRNKIIFDTEQKDANQNYDEIDIDTVKEAIEDNRIVCYYQPIVDLKTNKVVKYEALARMIDKDGNVIPLNRFLIPIAYTNVYNDLTKFVIHTVFETIKKYNISISMNLNLSDILDNVIYSMIIKEIKENKSLAKWLIIELLEYEYSQTDILKNRLNEIKSYGVKIALDDFGSGYANFTIFQQLPIDILKIDGSLIKELEHSNIAYTITKSISIFTTELNIETIAEFIHNEKTLEIVRKLGITKGQGYLLGKPSTLPTNK